MKNKAVVLVSGGIDSVTTLAMCIKQGYEVYAISFNYGQRHVIELEKAKKSIANLGIKNHKIINLDLRAFGGSALTDDAIDVPKYQSVDDIPDGVTVTYVPARNTIFLSYALAYAELVGAYDIFIGVHSQDHANYPDTRPEYTEAFEKMANLAVSYTTPENKIKIHAPIMTMTKAEIVKTGTDLGVNYADTISCYEANAEGASCGNCLSCTVRKSAFKENNIPDPTLYR